jgi:hypothetical protein
MASSLDDGRAISRMQATVLAMERDRPRDAAGRRVQVVPRPDRPERRRVSFDDVVVVVCFFALIGIVLVGAVVTLLAWITAISR